MPGKKLLQEFTPIDLEKARIIRTGVRANGGKAPSSAIELVHGFIQHLSKTYTMGAISRAHDQLIAEEASYRCH